MRIQPTSKSNLFLLEFITAVLLFALAAVVAVSFFVKAHGASERSADLTCATVLAESTAEELFSGAVVPKAASYHSDGRMQKEGDYLVEVDLNPLDDLTQIEISVSKDGRHIYHLNTAAYQLLGEVAP